jgi:hypothetical protein
MRFHNLPLQKMIIGQKQKNRTLRTSQHPAAKQKLEPPPSSCSLKVPSVRHPLTCKRRTRTWIPLQKPLPNEIYRLYSSQCGENVCKNIERVKVNVKNFLSRQPVERVTAPPSETRVPHRRALPR